MSKLGQIMDELVALIDEREKNPVAASYTNYLLDGGRDRIVQKYGEEAIELVIAAKNASREEMIHEGADLLYHFLVLLHDQGIALDDLAAELVRRR